MLKVCFKCKAEKPRTEFYVHKAMADGLLGKCKECTKNDTHAARHGESRERILAYDRERSKLPHRRENSFLQGQKNFEQHPERHRAGAKLRYAVKHGKLTPWPVCFVHTCEKKPEAHHYDYSKPLDVIWLCSAHHKQTHAISGAYK